MDPRIEWDDYFLDIAEAVAKRSTCPRLNVGCVITFNNRIVTTGYNGAPSGLPHCTEVECALVDDHCTRVVHAEMNALDQLEELCSGMKLYSTHDPCLRCRVALARHGIKKIVWRYPYGITSC